MAYASKKKLSNNAVVPIGSNLYGTCSTGSSEAIKVVNAPYFNVLVEGVTIHVCFVNGNSASHPALKVGTTAERPIMCNGQQKGVWESGGCVSFTLYNGYWVQNDVSNSSALESKLSAIFETPYQIPLTIQNGTFTNTDTTAVLVGNTLRLHVICTANNAINAGNIPNQIMLTITVNSPRIKYLYGMSNSGGGSGPNAQMQFNVNENVITASLAAIAQNISRGDEINSYVGIPVTLNLDEY